MKKETIYVDRYDYKNENDLLEEIFKQMSNFQRYNGYMPQNVRMTEKEYYAIRNYKADLFRYKNGGYYILCMKVVL